MDPKARLREVLTAHKEEHGTLYASPEALVIDPEVEQIRQAAMRFVSSDDFRTIFEEVEQSNQTE